MENCGVPFSACGQDGVGHIHWRMTGHLAGGKAKNSFISISAKEFNRLIAELRGHPPVDMLNQSGCTVTGEEGVIRTKHPYSICTTGVFGEDMIQVIKLGLSTFLGLIGRHKQQWQSSLQDLIHAPNEFDVGLRRE